MRLIEALPDGNFSLSENFLRGAVPQYAILSHTWGHANQEVTFEDMISGGGRDKAGYEKIRFCGQQAAEDGLRYFWVDSCCIRKSDDAELSESLRSMYRWYQRAVKCYVYLSDVSLLKRKSIDKVDVENTWVEAFRNCRWFTRGWTLQELLAPRSVEFFSRESKKLGDKQSLERQIHEVTKIPVAALRGSSLSQFTTDQKFEWAKNRRTAREEDWAYSLLGIFEISMAVMYGEGRAESIRRLRMEVKIVFKDQKCLQHLFVSDPRKDKERIEEAKGGLLVKSYHWILGHHNFQEWCDNQQSRLLWIKGDPGKGKTMLLCGIIDHLKKSKANTHCVTYFFCQATDPRINNAKGVLRGLLYLLVSQQPSLIEHVQRPHGHAGKNLFEDANAWLALCEIFTNILHDPALQNTYLIVDGLDECTEDLAKLLDFISAKLPLSPSVKWLVSSRNQPDIEERLDRLGDNVRLDLELNAKSISAAVDIYIEHKTSQLARDKKLDRETQEAVFKYLSSNANDTFLWVALVCQNLDQVKPWNIITKLKAFPSGLDSLYEQMMKQVLSSDEPDLYTGILATIAVVYRPVTLKELTSLVDLPEALAQNSQWLAQTVCLCGSFLAIRGDVIYLVHQSAKDYLLTKASAHIFPSGQGEVHYQAFSRSLVTMSSTIRRDIYGTNAPGYLIEEVMTPSPDPLAAARYPCIYWVDHLFAWDSSSENRQPDLQEGGSVHVFLKNKYLYWLEALSLCKRVSQGVLGMAKLETLVQKRSESPSLLELVRDARRFITYNKQAVETSPLQAYVSAIVFSPADSQIRRQFQREEPTWIKIKPAIGHKWSPCLHALEAHGRVVNSVAFSHDSTRLVTASDDCTIKLWDARSIEHLLTLEGHSGHVRQVAFSHNSAQIASVADDRTIRIWDTNSGKCMQTIEAHMDDVTSVAFSHDSTLLASASDDTTIKIWSNGGGDGSGKCLRTLRGHSKHVNSVAFSHNSMRLASASSDRTVRIWDVHNGECLQILEGHDLSVSSVAFSHGSDQLVSASNDGTLRTWNVENGNRLKIFKGHRDPVHSVVFSHDSTQLASAGEDCMVKIWDTGSGECVQTLEGHFYRITSIAFSCNSTWLASVSWDLTMRIWSASGSEHLQMVDSHSRTVNSVAFSHDLTWLASGSTDGSLRIWDVGSGEHVRTLEGHSACVTKVAFLHNSTLLASTSWDRTAKIWNVRSGECLQTLEGHGDHIISVAFSDSTRLASASDDLTVKIWDISTGECLQTLEGHSNYIRSVAFSHDSVWLASASDDNTIKVWKTSNGECLWTLKGHNGCVRSVTFSGNSTLLASASLDETVKIWNVDSSECIQTFSIGYIGRGMYKMAFDTTGSNLCTDFGTIALDTPMASNVATDRIICQDVRYVGVGINLTGEWITYNSKKLLWLPVEYRPWCSDISGRTIGIGCGSGKVWLCTLEVPP